MSEPTNPVNQETSEAGARAIEARRARRRFIKATGALALAAPVIESMTGADLMTVSAQAQSVQSEGIDGSFTGSVFQEPT